MHDRILIAGTGSGCGKTTVTSAVLRALQRRGVPLRAFKCGPDYIDPMFHTAVTGAPSRSLDLWLLPENRVLESLRRGCRGASIAVLKVGMGYYDGRGGALASASSFHLARAVGRANV